MKSGLTQNEIATLVNYRYAVAEPEKDVQIEFNQFLDDEYLSKYLKKFKNELGTPDLKVTASVFMKRLAFLSVIYLYAMSAYNKKLNVSPENIVLADAIKDGLWLPDFYFISQKTDICLEGKRDRWRSEAIRHLFTDNVNTVIDSVAKAAKIPKQILWENVAVYIFWLYEKILSHSQDEKIKQRAVDDFFYLVELAPGNLFGSYYNNPIARYCSDSVYQEGTDSFTRIRKTCCFSYMLKEKGEYCKTCPKICRYLKKENV